MAVPSNPNFGAGFDAAEFRQAIKSTMQMGSPNAVAEKVTFRWPVQKTYSGRTDPSGKPYSLTATVVDETTNEDVLIDCAVEYIDRTAVGSPIGEFNNPRVLITILDEDFASVETATEVLIGGNTYNIQYSRPLGLFSVTVYEVFAQAVDES
jgi:hypothetical protein